MLFVNRIVSCLLINLVFLAITSCSTKNLIEADLVLTNGKIWTVDKENPTAEALAVWRDRILAVGSSKDID